MKKKILKSFAHASILVLLQLFYLNLNITMPEETELLGAIGKTQRFFGNDRTATDTGFVFVNTAYDNSLLNVETDEGDTIKYVIADRSLLSRLFKNLADRGNNHRFVLCDILFDKPSPIDSSLQKHLNRLKKVILPEHPELGTAQKAFPINQPYAYANYTTYEGKLTKMKLYEPDNGAKTLPLVMYESCYPEKQMTAGWAGLWSGTQYAPASIYPRYYYTKENVDDREIRLGKLVSLLEMDSTLFYDNIVRNKILVIGNFSTDMHLTPIGQYVPGSMVLFNTFLTLEDEYHLLGWRWLLSIFFLFSLLSYYALYQHDNKHAKGKWFRVIHFLGLAGSCILISFISSLAFNVHTTVLLVILYFEGFHLVTKLAPKKQHKPRTKHHLQQLKPTV